MSAASLFKLPVSAMSACAAFMGFLACDPGRVVPASGAVLGVFLLSAGSSAMNNVQDRAIDGAMARTARRPMPAGTLSARKGLVASIAVLAAGAALLALTSASPAAPAAGMAGVLLYNGVYTPLKKRTSVALIPGIICGALPPLVGWLAAGGCPVSPRIVFIMALLGIWQVPHFWLILIAHGEDYRKSGIPTLLDTVKAPGLKMLILVWASVFSLMLLLMRPLMLLHTPASVLISLAIALAIPAVFSLVLVLSKKVSGYTFLFHFLNGSLLVITMLCVIDSLRQ